MMVSNLLSADEPAVGSIYTAEMLVNESTESIQADVIGAGMRPLARLLSRLTRASSSR